MRPKTWTLVQSYADAQEADSWKGGGDPNDHDEIKKRLEKAKKKLKERIEELESFYERY